MGRSLGGAARLRHSSDQTNGGHGTTTVRKGNKIKGHKPKRTSLLEFFLKTPGTSQGSQPPSQRISSTSTMAAMTSVAVAKSLTSFARSSYRRCPGNPSPTRQRSIPTRSCMAMRETLAPCWILATTAHSWSFTTMNSQR